jgi:hypothetical protein
MKNEAGHLQREILPIPDIPLCDLPPTAVEIDVGLDDHNHLITPEDRVHRAMAVE